MSVTDQLGPWFLLSWPVIGGAAVLAEFFAFGLTGRREESPPAGMIMCTLFWPLTIVALIILAVLAVPRELGRAIRLRGLRRRGIRFCRVCECTETAACDPPCHWVAADLCSNPACVATAAHEAEEATA